MAADHGAILLLLTGALFMVSLFLGITVDMRIFLLYFALICLLGPVWLAWLYYHYGLRGQCYLNVVDHLIYINPETLTVRLRPVRNQKSGEHESEESESGEQETEEPEAPPEEWWNRSFPISELGRWRITKEGIVMEFPDRKEGFLYLPLDVLASPEEMKDVIRLLSQQKNTEDENTER